MSHPAHLRLWLIFSAVLVTSLHTRAQLRHHTLFPSAFVDARNIDVWLPESYNENEQYSVIYMHDGQNLFNPKSSYIGVAWEADDVLDSLLREGVIANAIIVGIWNTPKRMREYQLAAPYATLCSDLRDWIFSDYGGRPLGEAYLKFIVEELKPFIDNTYSTKPGRKNTFIMGSSMGGLISLYAISRYPDIFGGAGCLSTHWPSSLNMNQSILGNRVLAYLSERLPNPEDHKIYFDYGTKSLDAHYEPYQLKMDSIMRRAGYQANQNWITRKFEGHEHSEKYWQMRLHVPLKFLLQKK